MLLAGIGLALIFAPVAATGTAAVALNDISAASATVNASGQLGGSIGQSYSTASSPAQSRTT